GVNERKPLVSELQRERRIALEPSRIGVDRIDETETGIEPAIMRSGAQSRAEHGAHVGVALFLLVGGKSTVDEFEWIDMMGCGRIAERDQSSREQGAEIHECPPSPTTMNGAHAD